jgi:hypothetical protein
MLLPSRNYRAATVRERHHFHKNQATLVFKHNHWIID